MEELDPRAGSWVPELKRQEQGQEALMGRMDEGSWQAGSRLLSASACLLLESCTLQLGSAPELRVSNEILCLQSTRWSHRALETSHVCGMGERYSGGELEAHVDHRREVWMRLWPCLPEPWETARLHLVSKGLDWSTELRDSDFCKLNLSIGAGQKQERIWQHVVVVLLLTL